MKVINLIGSPGTGKSTTAAGLFYLMKTEQESVELVTEYAKDMVWREYPKKAFQDQLYITAKQNRRLEVLRGKVEFVITDSPLLLGCLYVPSNYPSHWEPFTRQLFDSYDNFVVFLERVKPYNPVGRYQDEKGSNALSKKIKSFLISEKISHVSFPADAKAPENIYNLIKGLKKESGERVHDLTANSTATILKR